MKCVACPCCKNKRLFDSDRMRLDVVYRLAFSRHNLIGGQQD